MRRRPTLAANFLAWVCGSVLGCLGGWPCISCHEDSAPACTSASRRFSLGCIESCVHAKRKPVPAALCRLAAALQVHAELGWHRLQHPLSKSACHWAGAQGPVPALHGRVRFQAQSATWCRWPPSPSMLQTVIKQDSPLRGALWPALAEEMPGTACPAAPQACPQTHFPCLFFCVWLHCRILLQRPPAL